jgi:hypothetical protein
MGTGVRISDGDLDATTLSVAIRIHWTRDVSHMKEQLKRSQLF